MVRNILVTGSTGKQGLALIRALLNTGERLGHLKREGSEGQPEDEAKRATAHLEEDKSQQETDDTVYHIYALTRNPSGAAAQQLLVTHGNNVSLVQGDMDDAQSIENIFQERKESDGVGFWGVFAVLAFPGLGVNADGEERQGMVCLLAIASAVHFCPILELDSVMEREKIADAYPLDACRYVAEVRCSSLYLLFVP